MGRWRRGVVATALLAAAMWSSGAPLASAQTTEPTVSVAASSATRGVVLECDDVLRNVAADPSFTFHRSATTDAEAVTVHFVASGTAVAGRDYEPLPSTVTMAAGSNSVTLPVNPVEGPRGRITELHVAIDADAAYTVGTPGEASLELFSPKSASAPPTECGFAFREQDGMITRQVAVGQAPAAIVMEQLLAPATGPVPGTEVQISVVSGRLPPGLALRPDGSFAGAARTLGTYDATVRGCRNAPPGTCVEAVLRITVTARGLPATGTAVKPWATAGVALLGLGLLLVGRARDRVARLQP